MSFQTSRHSQYLRSCSLSTQVSTNGTRKVCSTLTQCSRIPANTSGHGFTICKGMPHRNPIGEVHLYLAPLPSWFSTIIMKIHSCPLVSAPRRVSVLRHKSKLEQNTSICGMQITQDVWH